MKKKVFFIGLAVLFTLSAVSGLSSGNISGFIGCLAIAAVFAFLAYRTSKPQRISESGGASSVIQSNTCTPPRKNLASTASSPTMASAATTPAPKPEFEFMQIKVSGVTFKNEKGTSRQTILRKIKFNDKPFDEYIELELRQYEHDGSPAYGVYANNLQIGNIPADMVQFVSDNWKRLDSISAIDVYGGGRDESGHAISYGCKITLKLRTE